MWKKLRIATVLGLTILAGSVIAGCGGSSRLSHQALVSKVDSACQTANSAVSQLGAPTASLTALTGYAEKVLPISQQLVTNLSALKASPSDETPLNKLLSALKNGDRGLKMMASASSIAQTSAASQIIIAQSVPTAANALGAATCAVSPSA